MLSLMTRSAELAQQVQGVALFAPVLRVAPKLLPPPPVMGVLTLLNAFFPKCDPVFVMHTDWQLSL